VARAGTVTSGICTASELRLSTNTASSPDSLPMPNASIATSPSSAVATPNPTRRRAALRSATRSASREGASGSVSVVGITTPSSR